MSIIVIVRDYLDKVKPIFYRANELGETENVQFWRGFVPAFVFFFETVISLVFSHFFSFQWRGGLVHVPVIRPELQIARTNSALFSTMPHFPGDIYLKDLSFLVPTNVRFPTTSFQSGFINAIFLAIPRNLSTLVRIRHYFLNGVPSGLRSTIGYRRGQTIFLFRIVGGHAPLWWGISPSFRVVVSCLFVFFFLQQSFLPNNPETHFFFS